MRARGITHTLGLTVIAQERRITEEAVKLALQVACTRLTVSNANSPQRQHNN